MVLCWRLQKDIIWSCVCPEKDLVVPRCPFWERFWQCAGPEAVDWVSFVNLKVVCSSIHFLDCDFYLQDVFSLRQQFFTTLMPHTGVCVGGRGGRGRGGGAWINIRYWTTIWTQKRCNTQLPQTKFYYVTLIITMFRKLINLTHWKMSMTVPGEI